MSEKEHVVTRHLDPDRNIMSIFLRKQAQGVADTDDKIRFEHAKRSLLARLIEI